MEVAGRYQEGSGRVSLHSERNSGATTALMVVVRSWRHYLRSFSTDGAVHNNILLAEMAMENRIFLSVGEDRVRSVIAESISQQC